MQTSNSSRLKIGEDEANLQDEGRGREVTEKVQSGFKGIFIYNDYGGNPHDLRCAKSNTLSPMEEKRATDKIKGGESNNKIEVNPNPYSVTKEKDKGQTTVRDPTRQSDR